MDQKEAPALLTKAQRFVIYIVSLGNILEAYDVYLYVFYAPILSKVFFGEMSSSLRLFNIVAFFALGFILRPIGGIVFGRLGDSIGRKKTFIASIVVMAVPTFMIGFLPGYSQVGYWAPILLALSRIMQIFPVGGELPGVFCYLYENADSNNRKFMSSFAGVGNQIGIALSAIECFLLEKFLPSDVFLEWGWRISFIMGGFIGIAVFFLRYYLHETKMFQQTVVNQKITDGTLSKVLKRNGKDILIGIGYGAAPTAGFHLFSILLPLYFHQLMDFFNFNEFSIAILIFLIATVPLPIFGLLGDKYSVKKLAIGACIGMLLLLGPFYFSIRAHSEYTILISSLFILCFTSITAFWPYLLSNLFPTAVRYTCVGLSFNISDGVLGGLSIMAILYSLQVTSDPGSFIWTILIACLISLFAFCKIKEKKV